MAPVQDPSGLDAGALADALGGCTDDDERLALLVAELHRRGCHRAAGSRYAVILGDGSALLLDRDAIAKAVEGRADGC